MCESGLEIVLLSTLLTFQDYTAGFKDPNVVDNNTSTSGTTTLLRATPAPPQRLQVY